MMTIIRSAAAAVVAFGAGSAQAAVLWTFEEIGGDVVGAFSGTLNLNGMTTNSAFVDSAYISDAQNTISNGVTFGTRYSFTNSTPVDFSSIDTFSFATTNSGSIFRISNTAVTVQNNYSGGPLAGALTFANTTFASLGVIPGTYVYTLPNDTVTVDFQVASPPVAPIPVPAALPMLLGALGLMGVVTRRRG